MRASVQRRPWKRLFASVQQLNRNPLLVDGLRRTRERALGQQEPCDRLAAARGRPADLALRELIALRGDSPGVLGELGLTVLQSWQRLAESQGRGRGELDVAVLFTDLAGFSTWAMESGDELAVTLLRRLSEAIEPPITARGGEVVKRLGDGLMGAFAVVADAVEAAFDASARAASIELDGYRPRLRTGIHLGRPRKLGGDYFGIDVNIAARLAEAAAPGEVLISGRTLAALDARSLTVDSRRFSAKGVPADLSAYAVWPT